MTRNIIWVSVKEYAMVSDKDFVMVSFKEFEWLVYVKNYHYSI